MTPNPLDLPPVPSIWLTDYRDEPAYGIPPSDAPPGTSAVSSALSRLDHALTRKAAA